MHTINKLAVLLLVQVLAFMPSYGQAGSQDYSQEFFGSAVPYVDQQLDQGFSDYDVFALDQAEIVSAAQLAGAAEFSFRLNLDNHFDWKLNLAQLEQRSADYIEIAMTDEGPVSMPRRDCITYAGYTDLAGESRFTISAGLLMGYVEMGNATYFIEPLARLSFGAPDNYFIVYNTTDVIDDSSLSCGFDEVQEHQHDHSEDFDQGGAHERSSGTLNCTEVDFALATDYSMFTKYGSVAGAVDHILTITSLMEGLYDDFDFDYIVRTTFVPTTSGSDPFTSSTNINTVLSDFRSWAPGGFAATHDIGQFWSDRNFDGSTIGLAYVGTVCGGSRYNVCEDYSVNFNSLRVLSAHECGHNWSATHTDQIMNSSIISSATAWNVTNQVQIFTHEGTRTCLSSCATTCPFSYLLVDYTSSGLWEYEALISIVSTGQVSGTADVTYDAGSLIILQEGFNASSDGGGEFHAILDGCSSPLTPPDEVSRLEDETPVEAVAADFIEVFPNPAVNQATVQFTVAETSQVEVTVFDMTGKMVAMPLPLQEIHATEQYTLAVDAADFPQGSYLVKVVINDSVETNLLNIVR